MQNTRFTGVVLPTMKKPLFPGLFLCLIAILIFGCADAASEYIDIYPEVDENCILSDGIYGLVEETVFALNREMTARIRMDHAFSAYPEHSGIYGVLYATEDITVTPDSDVLPPASGQGVMELFFPGTASCQIEGSGTVYAYFLPVPYLRISSNRSMVDVQYDTSFLTRNSGDNYNLFMLLDPHTLFFREETFDEDEVLQCVSSLGEIREESRAFRQATRYSDHLSCLAYDTPVLVQCCANTKEYYDRCSWIARPMTRAAEGAGYELWAFEEFAPEAPDLYDEFDRIMQAAASVAAEEYLLPEYPLDPFLVCILGDEEMMGMGTVAVSYSEPRAEASFCNTVFLSAGLMNLRDVSYRDFVIAHEIGHAVHQKTFSTHPLGWLSWLNEGVATSFGIKACESAGIRISVQELIEKDTLNDASIRKLKHFSSDMVFHINDVETFLQARESRPEDLMYFDDEENYVFGYYFAAYLEDVCGQRFMKRVSDTFYTALFSGREENFEQRYWSSELQCDIDGYYALLKTALGDSVYTAYPEYVFRHYADKIRLEKKLDLSGGVISVRDPAGSEVKVAYEGRELQNGRDFTVSYENDAETGQTRVIVRGTGLYTGELRTSLPDEGLTR